MYNCNKYFQNLYFHRQFEKMRIWYYKDNFVSKNLTSNFCEESQSCLSQWTWSLKSSNLCYTNTRQERNVNNWWQMVKLCTTLYVLKSQIRLKFELFINYLREQITKPLSRQLKSLSKYYLVQQNIRQWKSFLTIFKTKCQSF